jgi:hypothetical protein
MKFDTTPRGPLVNGELGGASRANVDQDGVFVSDAAGTTRVRMGRLSTSGSGEDATATYGLEVTNETGTVIIDGTSNMFRIQATGTLTSGSMADATDTTVETTLTGLGTFSAIPAFLAFVDDENTNAGGRFIGRQIEYLDPVWVANSSGGSPTLDILGVADTSAITLYLNGSDQAVVRLRSFNRSNTTKTFYGKFLILTETAI